MTHIARFQPYKFNYIYAFDSAPQSILTGPSPFTQETALETCAAHCILGSDMKVFRDTSAQGTLKAIFTNNLNVHGHCDCHAYVFKGYFDSHQAGSQVKLTAYIPEDKITANLVLDAPKGQEVGVEYNSTTSYLQLVNYRMFSSKVTLKNAGEVAKRR
jgi:hypothetical protein